MSDERDEIRARIDIVELVGASVRLDKKGKSYSGLCPFHADKKPSFHVTQETGRYICWSCGEKGDIFTWVMKTQNVEFPEALRFLAKMAGVTLSDRNRGIDTSSRELYEAAMSEAQSFFREQLPQSEVATAYCTRRGLTSEVLTEWGIGYAPEGGQALTARLKRKGFSLADCKSLFLVDQDAGGGFYDKFRGRIMFPIWNEKGELVAFGGRVLGASDPKYINSSDTPLYRKSRVLYGMNHAKKHLQKSRRAVLVEGYLDVIACHRAGVGSALASLGTMMSDEQAKLLKRWVDEVVVLYDSDSAGQKAADRASSMLVAEGLKVRVALMPEGLDPDTLLATLGPAAVQEAVEKGLSPFEYRLQALDRKLTPAEEDYWPQAVAILSEAPSALELEKHTFRLANQYPGIRDVVRAQKALVQDVNRFRANHVAPKPRTEQQSSGTLPRASLKRKMTAPEIILFRAFVDETYRSKGWLFVAHPELFSSDAAVQLATAMKLAFSPEPPGGPPSQWIHRIEPEDLQSLVEDILNDGRGDLLSEELISDAVLKLKDLMVQRDIDVAMKAADSASDRLKILNQLKEKKPDKHKKPPIDGLF